MLAVIESSTEDLKYDFFTGLMKSDSSEIGKRIEERRREHGAELGSIGDMTCKYAHIDGGPETRW